MDLYDEYLAPLVAHSEAVVVQEQPSAVVHKARTQFKDVLIPLPKSDLTDASRDKIRYERTADQPDLLFQTAAGLRQCQAAGIDLDLGFAPEHLEEVARTDMSLGGVIKGLEVVSRGADTGLLLCAQKGDVACRQVREWMKGVVEDPSIPAWSRDTAKLQMADPLGRYFEMGAKEQARTDADEAAHQERLQAVLQQTDMKQMIGRFVAAAQAPEADLPAVTGGAAPVLEAPATPSPGARAAQPAKPIGGKAARSPSGARKKGPTIH